MKRQVPTGSDPRRDLGELGETEAANRLLKDGYVILHRRWRCRSGELDIIAMHGETLVIIEVKTRTSGGKYGVAVEAVDARKQRQVRQLAEVFRLTTGCGDIPIRCDVIAITVNRHSEEIEQYTHISGAF